MKYNILISFNIEHVIELCGEFSFKQKVRSSKMQLLFLLFFPIHLVTSYWMESLDDAMAMKNCREYTIKHCKVNRESSNCRRFIKCWRKKHNLEIHDSFFGFWIIHFIFTNKVRLFILKWHTLGVKSKTSPRDFKMQLTIVT